MAFRQPARWPVFVMLVITLIAVGAAIAAWVRPLPETKTVSAPPAPTFTDQQIADAKAKVCDAYKLVDKGVIINTNRTNPVPGDEIGALATGIYGDFAPDAGGDYLLELIAAEPAAPNELAHSVKSFAMTLKQIAVNDLAGEPDSVRSPLLHTAEANSKTIAGMCE